MQAASLPAEFDSHFVDAMDSSIPGVLGNTHLPLAAPLEHYDESLVSLSSLESLADCFEGLDAATTTGTTGKTQTHAFTKLDSLGLPRLSIIPFRAEKGTRKRAKKAKDCDSAPGEEWKCIQCGAGEADTPLKRKGPDKKRNYCNACYIHWRVKVERSERGSARPVVSTNSGPRPISIAPKKLESNSCRSSLTPSIGQSDSDIKQHQYHPYNHQARTTHQSSKLSLASPTELMGVPASMATTLLPSHLVQKSNNESPSTIYFQSPQYFNYEWNSPSNMIFPQYMGNSVGHDNNRFDPIMHEYTPSPLSRLESMSNISPPELDALSSTFDFGLSQDDLFSASTNSSRRRQGSLGGEHIGVPLNSWSEGSNELYQNFQQQQHHQYQQHQQLLQQQRQLQQHLAHQLEQQQQQQQHEQQQQQLRFQHKQQASSQQQHQQQPQLSSAISNTYQTYAWPAGSGKPPIPATKLATRTENTSAANNSTTAATTATTTATKSNDPNSTAAVSVGSTSSLSSASASLAPVSSAVTTISTPHHHHHHQQQQQQLQQQNNNTLDWASSLEHQHQHQSDTTYLPVFDGSTTDADYNQVLGYGADITVDLDASTHEFLYGTGNVCGGGGVGGGGAAQFEEHGNDLEYPQQYQYEPVSQFLLREGYDFESGMI
ncbi:hypothetical protein BDR26DRAFT_1009431 [Obelidium mucronatum]|nr:hypothetical protein BDR26DRAFT_1009431 [Obelidium mucronatum]